MIAAQSVNHVERFVIDAGHIAERVESDYGYDLILFTFDEQGYMEPGMVRLQLKAAEELTLSGTGYIFDLDIRDYNLWLSEPMPVYLILYDASRRRAYWVHIQRHFAETSARRPKQGARTVRVAVPIRQTLNRRAVAGMRAAKQRILDHDRGVLYHVF